MPLLGAANRDPERWESPQEFDIFRPKRQHLGFGYGMHVCLGLNLARLEGHIWLDQLLDKLPEYELAETIDYGLRRDRRPRSQEACLLHRPAKAVPVAVDDHEAHAIDAVLLADRQRGRHD